MEWTEHTCWFSDFEQDGVYWLWDEKWKVIKFPNTKYLVKLGMIGPNYHIKGRYWLTVWESPTLEEAQHHVERQYAVTE